MVIPQLLSVRPRYRQELSKLTVSHMRMNVVKRVLSSRMEQIQVSSFLSSFPHASYLKSVSSKLPLWK